jgi:PBP1b-binding outer membrane lipoprotein LpoB
MKQITLIIAVSLFLAGNASQARADESMRAYKEATDNLIEAQRRLSEQNLEDDKKYAAEAAKPIICQNKKDCELKWERAVAWVVSNSEWKIQTQTDNLIQTFGPEEDSTSTAFLISKVPLSNGRYQITITADCGRRGLCIPERTWAKAMFGRYVSQKSSNR